MWGLGIRGLERSATMPKASSKSEFRGSRFEGRGRSPRPVLPFRVDRAPLVHGRAALVACARVPILRPGQRGFLRPSLDGMSQRGSERMHRNGLAPLLFATVSQGLDMRSDFC